MSSSHPRLAAAPAASSATAAAAAPLPNDENDNRDFWNVTPFTTEEEQQEIASLTIPEMAKIQSDLSGLSSVLSSLQPATTLLTHSSLPNLAVAVELSRLPQQATRAYCQAVQRCPDQVGPSRTRLFLEAENNDPRAAAAKLAKHWEVRVALFGEERAYLPMTLAGALKDEAMNLATRRIWQLLTVTDTAGRAILYACPGRRNFAEYSVEQEYVSLNMRNVNEHVSCVMYVHHVCSGPSSSF